MGYILKIVFCFKHLFDGKKRKYAVKPDFDHLSITETSLICPVRL